MHKAVGDHSISGANCCVCRGIDLPLMKTGTRGLWFSPILAQLSFLFSLNMLAYMYKFLMHLRRFEWAQADAGRRIRSMSARFALVRCHDTPSARLSARMRQSDHHSITGRPLSSHNFITKASAGMIQ